MIGGAIFAASYAGLAFGRLPWLGLGRTGIALLGAGLMLAAGVLSPGEALRAIDRDTMGLLLGMMLVVGALRLSGCLGWAARAIGVRARSPAALLGAVVALAGGLSAFLVNDAVCLVLAPLVLDLAREAGRRPLPYLLAVAMASNIGSVATITGNPQNIMIGSVSGIGYTRFTLSLAPVALAGLAVAAALIAIGCRRDLAARVPPVAAPAIALDRTAAIRAGVASAALVALLFAGVRPAGAAIGVGLVLLVAGRIAPRRLLREIDWPLLLMFAGLFVIVAGAQRALLSPELLDTVGRLRLDRPPVLALLAAGLSNLVSNVPAVLVLRPFVAALPDPASAWLVVAMAATLAGNLTLLGSIANLIVARKAAEAGVVVGFWPYFRLGAPLTLATLAIGLCWLQ